MKKAVVSLVVLLLILLAAIGVVYFGYYENDSLFEMEGSLNETGLVGTDRIVFANTGKTQTVSSNTVLVNDQFVGKIDKGSKVVAISPEGQAYIVQEGVVLADDMVITSRGETYSVYRIDNPEKSVSTSD